MENLKTTKYNDNIGILNVTDATQWSGLDVSQTGAWCYYDNLSSSNSTYGKLYNWYAVNTGKLCPTGWHVPSDTEWTTLKDYLGGAGIAGGKMKETGTIHWNSPNTGATNESGFTGLPGGTRDNNGTFNVLGYVGDWWSSTESGANAWFRNLSYLNGIVGRSDVGERWGFSVRCLRD
ncbi:MAG: fibrobacter succinogenes major paralogous domain-containing protein [Saprospiraceae bacterium]|nr:fibrobacter succinogenes major paralogous domain-containing protein [Saprospiraceae bacterium]